MSSSFDGRELELEMVDPGFELIRLFRHPGGDWEPPDPKYRNQRADPPPGHEDDYAVLYTADGIQAVAMECRILWADNRLDRYAYDVPRTQDYQVVRYRTGMPALFIPLDGDNKKTLGLPAGRDPEYLQHRAVAHLLFQRYGQTVHGLSWTSYHRNHPGRVYGLWHHHKATVRLAIHTANPYLRLAEDPAWQDLLTSNPDFAAVNP